MIPDEHKDEAAQLAKKVLADAARKQAAAPRWTLPDENGGHFPDKRRISEERWKGAYVGVLVIVLSAAICWAGSHIAGMVIAHDTSIMSGLARNAIAIDVIAEGQRTVMTYESFLGKALQKHDPKVVLPQDPRQGPMPEPFDAGAWELRKR